MIVKCCPRCRSLNLRQVRTGPGFVETECQWCGKLFVDSEAALQEFDGEPKPKRQKKQEEPFLFDELK